MNTEIAVDEVLWRGQAEFYFQGWLREDGG